MISPTSRDGVASHEHPLPPPKCRGTTRQVVSYLNGTFSGGPPIIGEIGMSFDPTEDVQACPTKVAVYKKKQSKKKKKKNYFPFYGRAQLVILKPPGHLNRLH
jgi:hypothetical protein